MEYIKRYIRFFILQIDMGKYNKRKNKKYQIIKSEPKPHQKKQQTEKEIKPVSFFSRISEDSYRIIALIPIILIAAIVPLIVYGKLLILTPLEKPNWFSGNFYIDFFAYYKGYWTVILTALSLFITILLFAFKKIKWKKSKIFIPLGFYVFFVVLSALLSMDKEVALRGFPDMHQGVFVLISYALLIVLVIQLVNHKKHMMMILWALVFSTIIASLIGYYQFIGLDPFNVLSVQKIVFPKALEPLISETSINSRNYMVYSTMGNSNFVGSLAALVIPLSLMSYFLSKKWTIKVISFLFIGLVVFLGFASGSRAGMLGVAASVVVMIILFRRILIKKIIPLTMLFLIIVSVGYALNQMTDGAVVREIKSMDLFGEIKKIQTELEENPNALRFESILTDEYKLMIKTNHDGITIEKKGKDLLFYTLEGEEITYQLNNMVYHLDDEVYRAYQVTMDTSYGFFNVNAYGRNFTVYHTIDGLKLVGINGNLVDAEEVSRLNIINGYENLFSSRVYIWAVSIPMLKDNIFVGQGPDMYPIAFNQNDFVAKANGMMINTIVDKPHNMYIQIGINTGVLSLIALLSVFVIYMVMSFKLYWKSHFNQPWQILGAGVFISVVSYLVAGIFNDQKTSIAPMFYILLGLGLVINEFVSTKNWNDGI